MATDRISVGLDIKNEGLRGEFAEIIGAQHGFYLTQPDHHRVADLLILELDKDRGKTFAQIQAILAVSPSTSEPRPLGGAVRSEPAIWRCRPLSRYGISPYNGGYRQKHRASGRNILDEHPVQACFGTVSLAFGGGGRRNRFVDTGRGRENLESAPDDVRFCH